VSIGIEEVENSALVEDQDGVFIDRSRSKSLPSVNSKVKEAVRNGCSVRATNQH
jgi:hypothetical protein